jgi:hypothetical protein
MIAAITALSQKPEEPRMHSVAYNGSQSDDMKLTDAEQRPGADFSL